MSSSVKNNDGKNPKNLYLDSGCSSFFLCSPLVSYSYINTRIFFNFILYSFLSNFWGQEKLQPCLIPNQDLLLVMKMLVIAMLRPTQLVDMVGYDDYFDGSFLQLFLLIVKVLVNFKP